MYVGMCWHVLRVSPVFYHLCSRVLAVLYVCVCVLYMLVCTCVPIENRFFFAIVLSRIIFEFSLSSFFFFFSFLVSSFAFPRWARKEEREREREKKRERDSTVRILDGKSLSRCFVSKSNSRLAFSLYN